MLALLSDPQTWTALCKIAIINIVLSGDNAVVIAMACRSLDPRQQRNAFLIGAAGIVVLMTVLTAFAALLMTLPYIQLVGSVLLFWIGIKLLLPEDGEEHIRDHTQFWSAVKTIIIADMIMSLDNVLGMAGAVQGHLGLLFVGLVITMPLILFGSALLMKLMERFPILVTLGSALLGFVAGEMAIGDVAVKDYVEAHLGFLETAAPVAGALFVVIAGKVLSRRAQAVADKRASESGEAAPAATPGGLRTET
jgi:YjbE family integral membrane protein